MKKALSIFICVLAAVLFLGTRLAHAQTLGPQQRLCDPEFQDCRADILTYIAQENVEIDVGFWLMDDARYSNALVAAWQRGVKIRLLMDPRCITEHSACAPVNQQLQDAGLPMRNRNTSGILHWKMFIFAGQGQVEFAGANLAPFEMVPETPYQNYTDEVVCFTNDPSLVQSFMRKFDDLWTNTTEFVNYANADIPLVRSYPTYPIDPQLNFPPDDSYRARSESAYAAENSKMDAFMFRITDESQSDAVIATLGRGVPVRLITDEGEYRNPDRLWDSYNVDKMYNAGVSVRLDGHQGINHEKAVILYGTHTVIFGSSNWTSPSSDTQREHNLFTTQSWAYDWLVSQFERKWNNAGSPVETKAFVPLPPDAPAYNTPAKGATNVPTTGTSLSWYAGLWAHNYDIYFGTSPNPPLVASNVHLGPSQFATDYRSFALPTLASGTTYYWQIVSKTMAFVSAAGPVWSFTTAGSASGDVPPTVALTSPTSGATFSAPGPVTLTASASDSDGTVTRVDFYNGVTLLGSASSAPYTFTWNNVPPGSYSLTAVATDNGNATSTSSPVSITVTNSLPAGWTDADIGATGATGAASSAGGTFTLTGAGADVWGATDALHYAWRTMSGDGSIVARVASIQNVNAWTKAGVMIRNSTSPSSAQGFMLVAASSAKGAPFQRRLADNNSTSVSTPGPLVTAPYWVKLVRSGSLLSAYASPDGAAWTLVASDTLALNSSILVGLGVSSHVAGTPATATFDNVTVTPAGGSPPAVALTSPSSGSAYTAPATISLAATASDSDGTIAQVQFFANSTLISTTTSAPYTFTWSNVPAGSYTLTAVATDNDGLTTTSSAVPVTVNPASNIPPTVNLTAPASGATFAAPATVNLSATASDSDGTVAKVQFFAGTTLLATVTNAPYTFSWTNVPAGSYSLTAVATDNLGASTTSSTASITVTSASNAPPTVSLTAPASGATFTAPATVNLSATASDSDGTVAKVQFFAGTTLLGTVTSAPYAFSWTNVPGGSYTLTAVATDNLGASTTSSAVSITVSSSSLPSGWSQADIGTPPFAGAGSYNAGTFTVTGSGADIWNSADQFHYVYRNLSGDGTIIARVTSIQNVAVWVKAAVMIRETLDPGSAEANMLVSSQKGVAFQRRDTTGGVSVNTAGSMSTAPHWVKLQRSGDNFFAYESSDGVSWTLVGSDTIHMATNVFIGLSVTSHTTGASATCTFDSVTIQ